MIFHIATVADWERAQESGSYTTSTVGRTLEEEVDRSGLGPGWLARGRAPGGGSLSGP